MSETGVRIRNLKKKFRTGFGFKTVTGIEHLDLDIFRGDVTGILGPNGAGKTTTFKILLGLIAPDAGTAEFNGKSSSSKENREKIGYLPENPYFYSHLTPCESLDFYGRLFNISKKERVKRVDELLTLVNLRHAGDRQLKKFSRGMLQRVGIAQALINDPDLLILDEPMSGLDPMGRKEMRDIIINCRERGKTVIFSSHILSDVEMLCDRVALLSSGKLAGTLSVDEIPDGRDTFWEITFSGAGTEQILSDASCKRAEIIRRKNRVLLKFDDEYIAKKLLSRILDDPGLRLISFGPRRDSLETILIRNSQEMVNNG